MAYDLLIKNGGTYPGRVVRSEYAHHHRRAQG